MKGSDQEGKPEKAKTVLRGEDNAGRREEMEGGSYQDV